MGLRQKKANYVIGERTFEIAETCVPIENSPYNVLCQDRCDA